MFDFSGLSDVELDGVQALLDSQRALLAEVDNAGESMSWKEWEIEFPACRSCVQGRIDDCCCI